MKKKKNKSSALSSGHGASRNGHHPSLPSFGGTAPTYFPGSVHQAPPPPALAGSSSFTSTHAPPAMRNGRRMDDGASSVASASGAMGLQMRVREGGSACFFFFFACFFAVLGGICFSETWISYGRRWWIYLMVVVPAVVSWGVGLWWWLCGRCTRVPGLQLFEFQ